MTNSANEPLPVDHDTAINDDSSDADDENDDPGGRGQFGADPQELQGDDPASGGS